MLVWITDAAGREERARIVDVSGDTVTTSAGEQIRRLRAADIVRVRVRAADPVWNGAAIGAGAAVASGLFFCTLMEPWDVCNTGGSLVRTGALGAGIGIGVDAIFRGRRTIYEAGSASLRAAPIVGRGAGGLQLSVSF